LLYDFVCFDDLKHQKRCEYFFITLENVYQNQKRQIAEFFQNELMDC